MADEPTYTHAQVSELTTWLRSEWEAERTPTAPQLTEAQLALLTPAEVNQARRDGRLNNLLNGKSN